MELPTIPRDRTCKAQYKDTYTSQDAAVRAHEFQQNHPWGRSPSSLMVPFLCGVCMRWHLQVVKGVMPCGDRRVFDPYERKST